ncbi:hypothetical protein GH714_033237 [Hevea brasiliensis]|uniref:Uncharacterized protein n=1 Tax=Hevea brasiliensis TaxID=3981 RepID=A0A6A6L3P8_HEVBR|nr:hypothetical protein GH714_033237 [Hevea brasiliensis]
MLKTPEDWRQLKRFNLASYSSPMQGLTRTPHHQLSDSDIYPSTFQSTPGRRNSQKMYGKSSLETPRKKLSKNSLPMISANGLLQMRKESLLTPNSTSTSSRPRRKWLLCL